MKFFLYQYCIFFVMMPDLVNFKIIVLGSQGVGKSTMIMRYIKGQYADNYNVTVGVQYATKIVPISTGEKIRLQIWDTAGQELFRALVRSFYKGISAVFFVYAIDHAPSFQQLKAWSQQLKENAHQEVIVFLIGARADNEQQRQVSTEQASAFLRQIQGALFVETSAKTGQNVDILFQKASEILYKKFMCNASFRNLVRPGEDTATGQRLTRGQSIVLKEATLKQDMTRAHNKKKCGCE